ncbi:hypothetical protein J2X47_002914 [Sphingomonas sp. BE270]|jgi:hypothetical protein|uniref:hypothetical protein n=1 Tax=unclassified Sphingomonas TaxID=196159 RepID=UPI000AE52F10|nr:MULTISPECIES: hypothetical protein [unclassified Sphingomonas]MDR6849655.1 hypothetical protein [Sphingomonas sp. BE137]MDR7258724.1 hypothetical protein [Sphingomonas sp. BE270]
MPQEFAYHRSLGPMIGVLLGIAIVEMCVVHLVVGALFGWTVALVVGVLDLSLVIGLALLLRSFRRLPVTIADGVLTLRAGLLKSVVVPVGQIAGLRATWDAAALKQRGVVNLALVSWPSVVIDLDPPVPTRRGRQVHAVAHKLDDPAAFHAAITALSRRDEQ